MVPNHIPSRTLGQYPVSIATSLALEGLSDTLEDGKRYSTPPIFGYQQILFNIRTLIRNIQGSYGSEETAGMDPDIVYALLVEELRLLPSIVKEMSNGSSIATFYFCDYSDFTRLYPKSRPRKANTPKQIFQQELESKVTTHLLNNRNVIDPDVFIAVYKTELKPTTSLNTGIVTHLPFDLLSYRNFPRLELVESHTGVIKKRHEWSTKLLDGKKLIRIPFDRMTIQMFGDSGQFLAPYPKAYRDLLLEVAEKFKWNTLTTRDRIELSVKSFRNASLLIAVTELYMKI